MCRRIDDEFQLIDELLAYAGKDLSHYFTKDNIPRTRITVHGTIIPTLAATTVLTRFAKSNDNAVKLSALKSSQSQNNNLSWWNSAEYEIGHITAAERPLRIINTLTSKVDF